MKPAEQIILNLKTTFAERAIDPNGLFLLSPDDAIEFIRMGIHEGLELQGVEGFYVTPAGAFQPVLEYSNDVADQTADREEFLEMTIDLIRSGETRALKFEVVLA